MSCSSCGRGSQRSVPVGETESRSDWVFGLSLLQITLLLCFAALLIYVTEQGEVSGQEPRQGAGETKTSQESLQASLDAATARNTALEKQLGEIALLVDDVKVMVGAKA